MNQKKYVAGIDIGTTKIVAIIGAENQYGKLEILGYGKAKSEGISRGVVNNIAKTIQSIKSAVAQAQIKAGVTITEAYVGIAGQHIHSSEISDYIIRDNPDEMIDLRDLEQLQQRIRSMNKYPSEEILHILPQEYKVDEQDEIRDPEGMVGKRLDGLFHVVIGSQNSIKNIERCVKDAGITLKGLTLEPLASADAVLSEDEKEMGIALIDIGGGTTDLAIFKDGYIRYTAVIPFGGNAIDRDIKTGCSILEKQAELVKIRFGSAWPAYTKANEIVNIPGLKGREPKEISITTLAEIIKARMEEIIEAVYSEMENYGLHEEKKKLGAGIVLCGGGSELKDLRQLVQYKTGLDTRIGSCNENLTSNSSKENKEIESPIYATAVGLLINALEREKMEERKSQLQLLPVKSQPIESVVPSFEKEIITENHEANTTKNEEIENEEEDKTPKKGLFNKIGDGFKGLGDGIKDFFKTMED
ncbi:MAG: cell division protein FtsA [Capnocytophaga sp.]|nr:cell division protein FtsA [Capnocytophaga sp.]